MHLYVHIPFCDGKCAYCGFYSVQYTEAKGDAFISALEKEIGRLYGEHQRPVLSTVYFGGGTPSVLSGKQIERVFDLITTRFRISEDVEWTVEGTPNTLTEDKTSLLIDRGANRISVGIQTFSDAVLKSMGRRHTAEDAVSGLKRLIALSGVRHGCDLIAGMPGVSKDQWRKDVSTVCDLGLKHVSVYALSLEEGSSLYRSYRERALDLPGEEETADLMQECVEMLDEAGLRRYEVSNFAVRGEECRHNLAYWRGADYLGIGPGASSRLGTTRRINKPDLDAYITASSVPGEAETVSYIEDLQERIMYHFRLSDGVDLDEFCSERHAGEDVKSEWLQRLEYLTDKGMVIRKGSRYLPAPGALDFADLTAEAFLD